MSEESKTAEDYLPTLDGDASTPDLSFDVTLKPEMKDKETNTTTEISNEDVHECYTFCMEIAKYLSKMDKKRRCDCMHEIVHLVMGAYQNQ